MRETSLSRTLKRIRQMFKYRNVDIEELMKSHTSMSEMLQRRSTLEDIGLLTASIEHEIKNPLAVIESEIYIMKRKFQAQPEIIARLEKIEEQQMRIYAAANIIVYLRPRQKLTQSRSSKININDLLYSCIKAVKKEIKTKDILFKFEPPHTARYFVSAYQPYLQQAIINILKNSVEAIHEAKREKGLITIESRIIRESPQLLKIEIRDNGCGIPRDHISSLTTLFTTKGDRKANSGVGLFITNKIVEIYEGRLEIESKVGEGTLVRIFLPKSS